MKFTRIVLAATALSAAPLAAQEAAAPAAGAEAQVTVGATVFGPQGNPVGTIENVAGGIATVNTGTNMAPLPVNAFGPGENGPTITVTQAQLNSLIEQQLAAAAQQRDAALVVGAPVMTADNQQLGTVDTIEGDNITLARMPQGDKFTLARDYFVVEDGALMARLTAAQVDEALAVTTAAPMADAEAEGETVVTTE